MVYAKLVTARETALAARLDAGLLDLPAYEKILLPDAADGQDPPRP